jgi:hypothetical protein
MATMKKEKSARIREIEPTKIGEADFISPTLTSIVNLALTVGVVVPV